MSRSPQQVYDALVQQHDMPLRPHACLTTPPNGRPADWSRVSGMLLGLAIGDSLGNTTEGCGAADRRRLVGEVRDYRPSRHSGNRAVGVPTDDTQMAFWTLEVLLAQGELDLDALTHAFVTRPIIGIGSTVRAFRREVLAGTPIDRAADRSAGNGALMRIAPVLVPYTSAPSAALWRDAALASRLTHNDTASTASCVAFIDLLWKALQLPAPPSPTWWADTFLATLDALVTDEVYRARGGRFNDAGRFNELVRIRLERARAEGWDTLTACDAFHSAAYLLETVPCVLWILERHGHDPVEAIVRAVNDTFDNDTTAAIVGAAVGALHGEDALPERWRANLLGRTSHGDDGRVQQLIAHARDRWFVA